MDALDPTSMNRRLRLAIVVSHPIQYYSPWFRHLAAHPSLDLKVFYLWDFGVQPRFDPNFKQTFQWDIPLLEGYEHEFVPNRSADHGTHHFRGLDNPGLVPTLHAWRPDAILLFGYTYLSHLRVILSRRLRAIPLLLRGDSHDLARPPGWKQQWKQRVRSLLFKRFAGFLAVGKANADYFRHCGVPEDRIHFVPHCVDNDRFRAAAPQALEEAKAWRTELGIPRDALVVLFVGKFESKKRPMDLLRAFDIASNILTGAGKPEPVLLFVGSGELEGKLQAMAGDRIGKTVFFSPFQNQSEMPKVYAAGDLLALPSCSETWGLAVNEAMNLGRPVIVSDRVGCGPDLVIPEATGWVFKTGDVADLAASLVKALGLGREGLSHRGRSALQRVDAYSYKAASLGLLDTLSKVATLSGTPGLD